MTNILGFHPSREMKIPCSQQNYYFPRFFVEFFLPLQRLVSSEFSLVELFKILLFLVIPLEFSVGFRSLF